jgi:hypothetical protein
MQDPSTCLTDSSFSPFLLAKKQRYRRPVSCLIAPCIVQRVLICLVLQLVVELPLTTATNNGRATWCTL